MELYNQTVLHPLGLTALAIAAMAMAIAKRQDALLPFLFLMVFVSAMQRVEVAGLDLTLTRLLILGGLVRLVVRSEWQWIKLNVMDFAVISFVLVTLLARNVLEGTFLVSAFGRAYDVLGIYVLARTFIRNEEEVLRFMGTVIWAAILAVWFYLFELRTGTNMFSIFGGVPETTVARSSTGALRAQGAFPHPILAGCFWAGLVAFAWAYTKTRRRVFGAVGMATMGLIVVSTSSSTPLISLFISAPLLLLYRFRHLTGVAVIGLACMLAVIAMVMDGPLWSLAAKVDLIGGSTGWHRSYLIGQAVNRWSEWWLLGTTSTAHWGFGLWDVTNQFVASAVAGGMLGLLAFNFLVYGAAYYTFRRLRTVTTQRQSIVVWALFVGIVSDIISFQGATYWEQANAMFMVKVAFSATLVQLSRIEFRGFHMARQRVPVDGLKAQGFRSKLDVSVEEISAFGLSSSNGKPS